MDAIERALDGVDDIDALVTDGVYMSTTIMHRLCTSALASASTPLEEIHLKLVKLRDDARRAAASASARAATNAAAMESSERAVRDIARATAGRTRDALCAELARARRRAELAMEALVLETSSASARARRRADALDDLADIAECVIAFASHGREKAVRLACGGVFVDADRTAEAASLARRALECLARVDASGCDATNGGDVARIIRQSMSALEEYCDDKENALLRAFDDALAAANVDAMSTAVNALWTFNDGASVVSRYIASRAMFISHDSIEEALAVRDIVERAVITGESDSRAETIYCAFYENIRDMLSREFRTIAGAFGDRANVVLSALVRRVAEQRVSDIIETLLSTELKTIDSLRQRLSFTSLTLSELEKTNGLIRELAKDDENVQLIMGADFFGEACTSLVDDECSCLDLAPDDDALLSASADEDRAIDVLCTNYEEAMRRCATCLDVTALDRASATLTQTILSRVLRLSKRRVNDAIVATTASSTRFDATTSIDDANTQTFQPLLRTAQCIGTWLKRAQHVTGASDAFASVRDELSRNMSTVFDAVAERAVHLIDVKLRVYQHSTDFASHDAACLAERETDACKVVMSVLDGVAALAKRALEATNADALLDEIAERFYALIFMHVCRFKYSTTGAVQLKLDLSAYVQWTCAHVKDVSILGRFKALAGRANVLVVGDESLDSLVRDLTDGSEYIHELDMLVKLRLTALPSISKAK